MELIMEPGEDNSNLSDVLVEDHICMERFPPSQWKQVPTLSELLRMDDPKADFLHWQTNILRFMLHLGSPVKSCRSWNIKIISIVLGVIGFLSILVNTISNSNATSLTPDVSDYADSIDLNFSSWIISPNKTLSPSETQHIKDFTFVLNNASKCSSSFRNNVEDEIFIVLVVSAPENIEARQAIRNTWGSVQNVDKYSIRLVFLLGRSELESDVLRRESILYGDMVSGDFVDSYRNLTSKHFFGFQWVLQFCSKATFVLKTDDDVFTDIFQLIGFVQRTIGESSIRTRCLLCQVLPEGTRPMRMSTGGKHIYSAIGSKWDVTREEYPYDIYPKYCAGMAYLATMDVIQDLYSIAQNTKYFWIDDVYVTGIIRELAGLEPLYLNLRYSSNPHQYRKWFDPQDQNHTQTRIQSSANKLPFLFAHLERGKLASEMMELWMKVSR